jgi:TolB protein
MVPRLPLAAVLMVVLAPPVAAEDLGLFTAHGDVGEVKHPGSVAFDAARGEYRITASGENMWGTRDAFHYAW